MTILGKYEVTGIEDLIPGAGNLVYVYDEEIQIGSYSFDCLPDIDGDIRIVIPRLAYVAEDYRRKGISTSVIQKISEIYLVRFENAVNNLVADKDDTHYTSEGWQWMQKCCNSQFATNDLEKIDVE